ncbi:unnamed protein product [Phytomonas sp. Hart1]|nr:unnamed protein product [Phytomonas sp. Hart1]|eukprot:CCW70340.1 unnamed protein product [Phytomonas sp. isolate Hart1]
MYQLPFGRIDLFIGPMFSGKTTMLMQRIKREMLARRTCCVVKYAQETRYDLKNVATHDQIKLRAHVAATRLSDLGEFWKLYDVIAIDEGQFFPDIVPFCNNAADAGKTVLVSALDSDYRREPFGQVCNLIPVSESVTKLSSVCMMCHTCPGSFTRRTVETEGQVLLGGIEMYITTCRKCYNLKIGPSKEAMEKVYQSIRKVQDECMIPTTSSFRCSTHPSREDQESFAETGSSLEHVGLNTPSPIKDTTDMEMPTYEAKVERKKTESDFQEKMPPL